MKRGIEMNIHDTFKTQRQLQHSIYTEFMKLPKEERLQDNLKHIIHEVIEVERETNFKHWKTPVPVDWNNVKNELVDVFIFFMNACNEAGMDVHELLMRTSEKQKINIDRQNNGY